MWHFMRARPASRGDGGGRRTRGVAFLCCLLLAGCSCRSSRSAGRVRFGPARVLVALEVKPSAAVRAADGTLAVGTADGQLLVLSADRRGRTWLTSAPAASAARGASGDTKVAPDPRRPYDSSVAALAFSSDGTKLLAAGGPRLAWWRVRPEVRLEAEIVGPQAITSAVLAPDGRSALFGTDQGHLLRWSLDAREARPLVELSCGALPVDPQRARLVPARRCPFGTYLELPTGQSVCTYPVTQLVRRGSLIARACRTGSVAAFRFGQSAHAHAIAGALAALSLLDERRALFARRDGEVRIYDFSEARELASFAGAGLPTAVAWDEKRKIVAVSTRSLIQLVHERGEAIGAVRVPAPPVWLGLGAGSVEALLQDGRLVSWVLTVRAEPARGPSGRP